MRLLRRLSRLFFPPSPDDEAAEREEYGRVYETEQQLERARYGRYAGTPAADAAEEDLDEFKRPPDPAP